MQATSHQNMHITNPFISSSTRSPSSTVTHSTLKGAGQTGDTRSTVGTGEKT